MDYHPVLIDFMDRMDGKIAYWVTLDEAQALYSSIERSGIKTYIESGTCHGYSSCWAATIADEIYTFDIVNRRKIWEIEKSLMILGEKVNFYEKSFDEGVVELLREKGNVPLYFFIDGNHHNSGVVGDFNAIHPFLKPGDVIMFHDSKKEEAVRKFMGRVEKRFPSWGRLEIHTDRGMTEWTVR